MVATAAPRTRRLAVVAVTLAAALSALSPLASPATAAPTPIRPSGLDRGADPGIPLLIGNTIVDGGTRIRATTRGTHDALWLTRRGYVLRDLQVGRRSVSRLVFVGRDGHQVELAHARTWYDVAVSPTGRRLAFAKALDRDDTRSVITVVNPNTGRVVARRLLRYAGLAAVTDHKVLVGQRLGWRDPVTLWWDYRSDRLRRWYGEAALGADLVHDRVLFDQNWLGEFCTRVARFSRPDRTLWASCAASPRQWSPGGSRALSTHTYFDAAGTDHWDVVDSRTGRVQTTVRGRLDWDAAWEDDGHVLVLAQGDDGWAAVVRCDLAGRCERASRLWDVPLPEPSLYYAAPPVVLPRS